MSSKQLIVSWPYPCHLPYLHKIGSEMITAIIKWDKIDDGKIDRIELNDLK